MTADISLNRIFDPQNFSGSDAKNELSFTRLKVSIVVTTFYINIFGQT